MPLFVDAVLLRHRLYIDKEATFWCLLCIHSLLDAMHQHSIIIAMIGVVIRE